MRPRRGSIAPAAARSAITRVMVVRWTPSSSARCSCVIGSSSPPVRSWRSSRRRQARACTSCRALQATDCITSAKSASAKPSSSAFSRGMPRRASSIRAASIRSAGPPTCTMAVEEAGLPPPLISPPIAPSQPTTPTSAERPSCIAPMRDTTAPAPRKCTWVTSSKASNRTRLGGREIRSMCGSRPMSSSAGRLARSLLPRMRPGGADPGSSRLGIR